MLADCHLHTCFSADSDTPARDQIEAAIRLGLPKICITDHQDCGSHGMCELDFVLDLPSYLSEIRALSDEYAGRIQVGTGIELGLMLRAQEEIEAIEQSIQVDFVIGSSHFVDGYDVFYPEYFKGRSEEASYRRYFESTLARVQAMDCFDSLGHLDFIVRYGPTKNENYHPADYADVIDEILKTLIRKGKALECNTAGFRFRLGHPNPHEWILKRFRELGGELITVGSDAHKPQDIAVAFPQAAELLKACGYRYYAVYRNRKPVMELIP